MGFRVLTLLSPDLSETGRRSELKRFRLLATSNIQGLLKLGF